MNLIYNSRIVLLYLNSRILDDGSLVMTFYIKLISIEFDLLLPNCRTILKQPNSTPFLKNPEF